MIYQSWLKTEGTGQHWSGFLLRQASVLLMLAAIAATTAAGLLSAPQAQAQEPGKSISATIHFDRTQPEPGDPVRVTAVISNAQSPTPVTVNILLELDNGMDLTDPGDWSECSAKSCRSLNVTTEPGRDQELTATVILTDAGIERTVSVTIEGVVDGGGLSALARTERVITAYGTPDNGEAKPETAGLAPPPEPETNPVKTVYVRVKSNRTSWISILAISSVVLAAAVLLLILGGARTPSRRAIAGLARKVTSPITEYGSTDGSQEENRKVNRIAFYLSLLSTGIYLAYGGPVGPLTMVFPLSLLVMAQWSRSSRWLGWLLAILPALQVWSVSHHNRMGYWGQDSALPGELAVAAVAAGAAAWGWRWGMQKLHSGR